jgi:hypothetical protein
MKNFLAMPGILKMVTVLGFFTLVWVATSLVNGVDVFGKHVDTATWWAEGAGYCCLFAALIASWSSILMIMRSRYGRPVCIVGWLAIAASSLLGAYIAEVPYVSYMPGIVSSLIMTACVAGYLYLSKRTKTYFCG